VGVPIGRCKYILAGARHQKCSLASRCHHLVKKFWTGIGGWADQQLPDGTVIWTSPSEMVHMR
jgi:hypothetical protein